MLVLSPDFGEVVVDVFQDVPQTDALRVAHDAHLVHGSNVAFKAALHIAEQVFNRGQLRIGVFNFPCTGACRERGELFFQQLRIVFVLAGKNVHHITEPVAQTLDSFLYIIVHNSHAPLNGFFEVIGVG